LSITLIIKFRAGNRPTPEVSAPSLSTNGDIVFPKCANVDCAEADRTWDGVVIGRITAQDKTIQFEPKSQTLKIDKPTITILRTDKGISASNVRIKSIEYVGQDGQLATTYVSEGSEGANSKDKGVYFKNPEGGTANNENTRLSGPGAGYLVAGSYKVKVCVEGTYDLTAANATVDAEKYIAPIGFTLGCLDGIDLVVTPKSLSPGMLTVDKTSFVYTGKVAKPNISLKDGSNILDEGDEGTTSADYVWTTRQDVTTTNIDVDTYPITIVGAGNYRGKIEKTYSITKAELSFEQFPSYTFSKKYDGTTAVTTEDSAAFVAEFMGYPPSVTEVLGQDDYVIKDGSLKYTNKDVGKGKTVTATIELSTKAESPARNYKLKTNSFSWSGGVIEKGEVALEMLKVTYDNPAKDFKSDEDNIVLYNKSAKEVKVGWASGVSNSGAKFTVKYDGETTKPVTEGTYAVTVDITEGNNLLGATEVALGSLVIASASRPIVEDTSPADTSYYALSSVTLKVAAVNPKDGKTSGLSYQWYQQSDTGLVAIKGKTSNSLVVNDTVVGAKSYAVRVTYKGSEQDTASVMSRTAVVTTLPRPLSLKGAVIVCNQQFEYDGSAKTVTAADLSVTVGSETVDPQYYEIVKPIRNNINAGEAVVTIKGIGAYKDTETGSFTISKKPLDISDLQILYQVDYNGTTQEIRVSPVAGKSGIGEVTRIYDGDSARLNAGTWNVELSIGEGTNYEASESIQLSQPYVIRKTLIDESMLNYSGVPKEVAWNGQNQGIATPTLTGVGTFYTGDLSVVYIPSNDPSAELTEAKDSATYTVRVKIAGDRNFASYVLDLGTIEIHGKEWVIGVAEVAREIPNAKSSEAVSIAPVKVTAGEVTVGPNPAGSGASLNIFWNGSKAVSGKLSVYTSLGKKVASVPVSGTKKIGSWTTTGAPEGTYLIKGVLTAKDGSKVTVSNLVSVTK